MADYTQPKDVDKRLRYFNGQFLREQDLIDEQKYHLDRQRRHQRQFHAPGIAEGLSVTAAASGATVTVAPGTAVDAKGQTLVLAAPETLALSGALNTTKRLVLGYRALETDVAETGSTSYTRWHEKPLLSAIDLDEALQDRIVLARLTISSAGAVTVDPSERQYAGVLLPGGGSLRVGATGKLDASTGLRIGGDSELSGTLTVSASLGIATATPQERQQIGSAFAFHDGAAKVLAFGWAPSTGRALQAGIPAELRWDPAAGTLQLGTDTTTRAANATGVTVPATLTLKQGSVGIGTATPVARLEVVGNWTGDEGALRLTGDRPTLRFQGGSAANNESWLLQVASTGPGNFELQRRSGTSWAAQLSVSTAGQLGVGTATPTARLSVVAAGASELSGTSRSSTLLVSGGALGNAAGSELALASIGFTGHNQISLGIRAQRTAAAGDWNTTAIGLGMDVDASVRAGANLWLHANKNVGIGTPTPGRSLHIQQGTGPIPLIGGDNRPGLVINGDYPELTLWSGFNNGSHGATIRLGSYIDDTRQKFKHWVIGTSARNSSFLDFGFGTDDSNPHNGIRNYVGRTVMTLTEVGSLGIGTLYPTERLHIDNGNLRIRQFPANDSTPALTALQLVNRGPGGAESLWTVYTAAIGGGWGVNPNAFEVWQYPSGGQRFQIRSDGHTVLVPNGGSVGIGWSPDTNFRLDVAGSIKMPAQSQIYSSGRLHIHGEEDLYLLHKGTTIVGKAWESSGNMIVEGLLGVGGQSFWPRHGGWGGGIHTFDLEAEGTIWCNNDILARGTFHDRRSDLAENYLSDSALEPGDVVCFAADSDTIIRSERPNDLAVCGIISTEPGMLLNSDIDRPDSDQQLFPVALSGRVPCKVTDQNGPIRRGDLLTSSSTPGHAMRAQPIEIDGQVIFRPGTIIGKALGNHSSGQGVIDVFMALA